MAKMGWVSTIVLAGTFAFSGTAAAQALPVSVEASGNVANARIGLAGQTLADVTLVFEDATGLNASSLGISAERINLTDLVGRLPDANLTSIPGTLPLLITIEPGALGGLSFRNTGRIEVHTHAIPYMVGSSFRLLKAPLGGAFRDVTDEIAQGSVRARGTYGGFSQFLIVADLRPTGLVVNEKFGQLRANVAALPVTERAAFDALLDDAQAAVARADYAAAISNIDAFRARAAARAGTYLPNQWRATRDVTNHAGELSAGAATLRFSVAYLRDFGH